MKCSNIKTTKTWFSRWINLKCEDLPSKVIRFFRKSKQKHQIHQNVNYLILQVRLSKSYGTSPTPLLLSLCSLIFSIYYLRYKLWYFTKWNCFFDRLDKSADWDYSIAVDLSQLAMKCIGPSPRPHFVAIVTQLRSLFERWKKQKDAQATANAQQKRA